MSKRKILVTGGCGFIGRNIVKGFADAGHDVTVVDIRCVPFRDDVKFVDLDITNKQAVIDACAGMDSIVHNASLVQTKQGQEEIIWKVNLDGTKNILEACKTHAIPRLVYISSASAVYEGGDIENGDETLPYSSISQASYADSKIAAEKEALAFSGTGVTQVCALRPHVVFGPEDNRFVPNILEKASSGKLKREIGNRDKLSDFTYVTNFIDAIVMAEEALVEGSAVCGQAYFITNGEPKAFFQFVEEFMIEMGYPKIQGKVPFWLAYSAAALVELWFNIRKGDVTVENGMSRFAINYMVTHHYYSIDKAKRDFGWTPKVSLAEGIKITVEHLREIKHPLLPK
jgi:sterol-4alpha-carboxylate 3-dehydrogenase (decarboxylating)